MNVNSAGVLRIVACVLLLGVGCKKETVVKPPPVSQVKDSTASPRGSIYQLDMTFEDQHQHNVAWRDLGGKVEVMAMIFTHCKYACPAITHTIKHVQELVAPEDRPFVHYTLISFDPQRDSASRLMEFSNEMGLDDQWTLLHGSIEDVQTVAALLDVKFKAMENGAFSHQNVILVVNKNGEIARRSEGSDQDPKELNRIIHQLIHTKDSTSA